MVPRTKWSDADRTKLTTLMDKLTAVTIDLKPLCDRERQMKRAIPIESTIAAACDIMQAAIDDLRDVIKRLDGMFDATRQTPVAETARKIAKKTTSRRPTAR